MGEGDHVQRDLTLRGVSIFGPPPLGAIHIPWRNGLCVLYGLNGAGKTRVLRHLESALSGYGTDDGTALLHLTYQEAHDPTSPFGGHDGLDRNQRPRRSNVVQASLRSRWESGVWGELGDPPSTLSALALEIVENSYPDGISADALRAVASSRHFCVEPVGVEAPGWIAHVAVELPELGPERDELLYIHQNWLNHDPVTGRAINPRFADPDIDPIEIPPVDPDDVDGLGPDGAADYYLDMEYDPEQVTHLLGPVESGLDVVPWALIPIVQGDAVRGGAPVGGVLSEAVGERDLTRATVLALRDRTEDGNLFVPPLTETGGFSPGAMAMMDAYSDRANEILHSMLPDSPALACEPRPLDDWLEGIPLRWVAVEAAARVELESLSQAQRRWARFAVGVALLEPSGGDECIILDEPEASLHPLAVRQVASVLASGVLGDAPVFVASHAPAFIEHADRAVHVFRDHRRRTRVEPLEDPASTPLVLGLAPTDALALIRTFVLVEGPQDEIILGGLLGSELRAAAAHILPFGGAKANKEIDARHLAQFTDARLYLIVDKARHEIYQRAFDELLSGDLMDPAGLDGTWSRHFSKNPTGEEVFVKKFCVRAMELGVIDRVVLDGVPADDILDYLPPGEFVPHASSWDDLRRQKEKEGAKGAFKPWLEKSRKADLSAQHLREVVQGMTEIPSDIAALGRRLNSPQSSAP